MRLTPCGRLRRAFRKLAGRKSVAVLIDADNVNDVHMAEAAKIAKALGHVVSGACYHVASNRLAGRKLKVALANGLVDIPVSIGRGKNATDLRLALDGCLLGASGVVDDVVIASSDRDFGVLASGLREMGIAVHGVGSPLSHKNWRKACSTFAVVGPRPNGNGKSRISPIEQFADIVRKFVTKSGGQVTLPILGTHIHQRLPGFRPSQYGCKTMSILVAKTGSFDIEDGVVRIVPLPPSNNRATMAA